MFEIFRKTDEIDPANEARKTILTELETSIQSGDFTDAKTLAKVYSTITPETPAPKQAMSDQVKVAIISAIASVVGILAVIRHEEVNVIASKALGFIVKPKI